MSWQPHAHRLAGQVTDPVSRWREPIEATPRHLFVPRWWSQPAGSGEWSLCDGPGDPEQWLRAAYIDQTLVTRVGPVHADHAQPGDHPTGRPTSSSTLPSLVVRLLQHLRVYDGAGVLDVGTGSGYSAAILSRRLGDAHVASVDVDPYLTKVAAERLDRIGLHPDVQTIDATGPLPGEYDRIVSMVAVRPIPASWLAALRPGGRLVTTITDTPIIITATKDDDGGATGQVEWDRAAFMTTRTGDDYPLGVDAVHAELRDRDGEHVGPGRYPVINVTEAWELRAAMELTAPGIDYRYTETEDGQRTAWMVHEDGSWARAAGAKGQPPMVHQGGPRRLWDVLDDLRHQWLTDGYLQVYGARVFIRPNGTLLFARGNWKAVIKA